MHSFQHFRRLMDLSAPLLPPSSPRIDSNLSFTFYSDFRVVSGALWGRGYFRQLWLRRYKCSTHYLALIPEPSNATI
jgi:hypothetical protein